MVVGMVLMWLVMCSILVHSVHHPIDEHHNNVNPKHLRLAFCVTGQLARLELISKIKNIFLPNSMLGSVVHIFVLLDRNDLGVKQTFWRYDYSDNLYGSFNASSLKRYIDDRISDQILSSISAQQKGVMNRIRTHVRIEPPAQNNFTVRGRRIPVTNKTGPSDYFKGVTVEVEPAEVRWQNNMRWLSGLRECTKWVQHTELQQKWFYTNVVRLRDDTYAFAPWLLSPTEKYLGGFVSAGFGSNFGINDRNFVVDRKFADSLFRGVTEDYYFNETLDLFSWNNPERRIYKVAETKGIELRNTTICEQPLLPLRGKLNKTHWRTHVPYAEQMHAACTGRFFLERRTRRLGESRAGDGLPFFSLAWWTSWLWPRPQAPPANELEDEIDLSVNDDDPTVENEFMPCCKPSWLKMMLSGAAKIYNVNY